MLAYKYRKYVESVDRDRVNDMIRNQYIWAPTRSALVDLDPDDMHFDYIRNYVSPVNMAAYKMMLRRNGIRDEIDVHGRIRLGLYATDERFGRYGVISLCEVGNSQYMWDKYAGGNSGLCIEYDVVGPDDAPEAPFKRVIYGGVYNVTTSLCVRMISSNNEVAKQASRELTEGIVYSKGVQFRLEREVRALSSIEDGDERGGTISLSMTRIIIGSDINGEDRRRLIESCDKAGIGYVDRL